MHLFTAAIASSLLALVSAAPTASKTPLDSSSSINPTTLSQFAVSTGAITFNTPDGKIFKDGHSSDITTLLTFSFPEASSGKTCTLNFNTPLSYSGQFDVFTSLMPATESTATWPSGNLRDRYLGRLELDSYGVAQLVDDVSPALVGGFPCPQGVMGMELVGAGDVVDVEWVQGASGRVNILFY